MISVTDVTKKFNGFTALDGLNMQIPKGSIYGLVGPNGAGKTTIINHINGSLKQNSGTVTVGGEPVYENISVKQRIATIADDWYYFGSASIGEMAGFYKSIYKSFNDERYKKLRELFNISDKKQVRSLSKGMKKQTAFHIILSCMPDYLILDEPLDGLDPVMRKQVLNLIIDDVSARDMTVLVSSHNLRELEDICDHVGIIHKGKMIIEKPLDDLKGSVHKYQLAFSDGIPKELEQKLNVLHISNIASVYQVIVKGDTDENDSLIKSYDPLIFDKVSLTLEEIFIYELGGLGYDFNGIMV